MTTGIVTLDVSEFDGILVVDSRLIAERLGIQHESFLKTIRKHRERIEQKFGHLRFEIGTVRNSVGAVNETTFVMLTEPQATTLMTLSKNTDQVVECKLDLVDAFEKAKHAIKTVIPAQNDRIRELELELEISKSKERVMDRQDSMLTLHGSAVVLALAGRADQIVEVEKPTLEVIDDRHNLRFEGQTLKQVAEYIEKAHGIRFKSGADLKRALLKLGAEGLIAQSPRTVTADYIPKEFLREVYGLLTRGDRQKLIGE